MYKNEQTNASDINELIERRRSWVSTLRFDIEMMLYPVTGAAIEFYNRANNFLY